MEKSVAMALAWCCIRLLQVLDKFILIGCELGIFVGGKLSTTPLTHSERGQLPYSTMPRCDIEVSPTYTYFQ